MLTADHESRETFGGYGSAPARELPFAMNLWKVQNIYYEVLQSIYPEQLKKAGQSLPEAPE